MSKTMFFPETAYFPEKLQQDYETDIDVLIKTLNKTYMESTKKNNRIKVCLHLLETRI